MGMIIGSFKNGEIHSSAATFHVAFLFPITGLAVSIVSYLFARDYGDKH
jgi:hypothetical protein